MQNRWGDMMPLMGENCRELHFRIGMIDDASDMVCKFHYSGRIPANIQFVGSLHKSGGLFGDMGEMVAACFFSIPPTRWSEDVLELSRLVRGNEKVPLSKLLSLSCKELKKNGFDLIVSFADWTQKHHGGIYQSASWNYSGLRNKRMDGVIVDGCFIPGRSANSRWGTQSPNKLSHIIGRTVFPSYDDGKYLYWKALGSNGEKKAKRLGLLKLPYDKPIKEGFDL